MYCNVKVGDDRVVSLDVGNPWTTDGAQLIGATIAARPIGFVVSKLTFEAPPGLQAMAFVSRVDVPRRMGSGQTAYLDRTPLLSSSLVLVWEDDGKTIAKDSDKMSASELAKFNPFVRSGATISVVDTERQNLYYIAETECLGPYDPKWTYNKVSGDALLSYIVKRITIRDLNNAVESEFSARAHVAKLEMRVRELEGQASELDRTLRQLHDAKMAFGAFAGWTRVLIEHPLFNNQLVARLARWIGGFGFVEKECAERLHRIIANSGDNIIMPDQLIKAVFEEFKRFYGNEVG